MITFIYLLILNLNLNPCNQTVIRPHILETVRGLLKGVKNIVRFAQALCSYYIKRKRPRQLRLVQKIIILYLLIDFPVDLLHFLTRFARQKHANRLGKVNLGILTKYLAGRPQILHLPLLARNISFCLSTA